MLHLLSLVITGFLLFSNISCGKLLRTAASKDKKPTPEVAQEEEKKEEIKKTIDNISTILGEDFVAEVGKEAIKEVLTQEDFLESKIVQSLKNAKATFESKKEAMKIASADALDPFTTDIQSMQDAYDKTYALAAAIATLEKSAPSDGKIAHAKEELEKAVSSTENALSTLTNAINLKQKENSSRDQYRSVTSNQQKKQAENYRNQAEKTVANAGVDIKDCLDKDSDKCLNNEATQGSKTEEE